MQTVWSSNLIIQDIDSRVKAGGVAQSGVEQSLYTFTQFKAITDTFADFSHYKN